MRCEITENSKICTSPYRRYINLLLSFASSVDIETSRCSALPLFRNMSSDEQKIDPIDLSVCIRVLSKFTSHKAIPLFESSEFAQLRPLLRSIFYVQKRAKKKHLQHKRVKCKQHDSQAKSTCLLRLGRENSLRQLQLDHLLPPDGCVQLLSTQDQIEYKPAPSAAYPQRLLKSTMCYICKLSYRTLHFFYHSLCPACAQLNFEKRSQTTDLSGRVALVTGGRIKIGYRTVLKLLRANCSVIVTTRFPVDLVTRLNSENDFDQWKALVHVYGVDFRYTQLIEYFTSMLIEKYDRLDFLINNACQTIQRTNEFYQHLIHHERIINYSSLSIDQQTILDDNREFYQRLYHSFQNRPLFLNSPNYFESTPQILSQSEIAPIQFDVNNQPIDFRSHNSWTSKLHELTSREIHDVLTINTVAPFILNSQLKGLMADKHPQPACPKFIINVSAMEGSFSRKNKTVRHPHTNAAKAALNMMTRTSANDYKTSNIYMVSVDTGKIDVEILRGSSQKNLIRCV
jgi:NAD(P)-dependent dehydrogenase (short-subunit alcohol dehydrogenase family)